VLRILNKCVYNACSPHNKHRWICRVFVLLMLLFIPVCIFMLSISIPIWMKGC